MSQRAPKRVLKHDRTSGCYFSPDHPESAKTDSLPGDAPFPDGISTDFSLVLFARRVVSYFFPLNFTVHCSPPGNLRSWLGISSLTPKVPLAESTTRFTIVTFAA